MRRKDREITDFNKMVNILNGCDCCRLGFVDGDEAYIVPLNFGYDVCGEKLFLYFHSAKAGRKIDLALKQAQAAFEADTGHSLMTGEEACAYSFRYQSVMGKGTLSIVDNSEEKIHGMRLIMKHYSEKKEWHFDEKVLNATAVIKLEVTEWSCKQH